VLATDRMSRLRSVGGAAVLADGSTRQNINYFFSKYTNYNMLDGSIIFNADFTKVTAH